MITYLIFIPGSDLTIVTNIIIMFIFIADGHKITHAIELLFYFIKYHQEKKINALFTHIHMKLPGKL